MLIYQSYLTKSTELNKS